MGFEARCGPFLDLTSLINRCLAPMRFCAVGLNSCTLPILIGRGAFPLSRIFGNCP